MVDDVAEQAHVLVGAAELLAGGRDASLQADRLQQAQGSDVPAGLVRGLDVLGSQLGDRLALACLALAWPVSQLGLPLLPSETLPKSETYLAITGPTWGQFGHLYPSLDAESSKDSW